MLPLFFKSNYSSSKLKIYFKKFNPDIKSVLPDYKTTGSSGMDISSASTDKIIVEPGSTALIPTNIVMEIPDGYEGQVRPRSGLAFKKSVTVLNTPGTIDSDYRGEIKVILMNHGKEPFEVNFGDRIAQLIISKYEKAELIEIEELSDTQRGDGGYGSTGVR